MLKCDYCGQYHREMVKVTSVVTIVLSGVREQATTRDKIVCPLEAEDFYRSFSPSESVSISMEDVLL